MIVVGIVGILAAMAVASVTKPRLAAQKNTCIANLRQIENSKQLWAVENNKVTGDTPTMAAIKPYFRYPAVCPANGTYTINAIGTNATCSIAGHSL